ncbi:MAG TPA: 4Fe-4S dicluster domain-containing protein, partial [Candidatus Bathyarchaeota archaeon]|nr:4Fe-4S dicluster domain-containing protein [Candidatus Bathyarchaeota archaeon]
MPNWCYKGAWLHEGADTGPGWGSSGVRGVGVASSLTDLMTMAKPEEALKAKLTALVAVKPDACLQCARCTSGCTAFRLLELKPHKIVGSARLGFLEELVSSTAIWDCALCLKCAERCPQGISAAE